MKNSSILILGASYKKDVADTREAAVYSLYEELESYEAQIEIMDPHVKAIKINGQTKRTLELDYSQLACYDLVILLVDHSQFDYQNILEHSQLILDTKGKFPANEKVISL